MARPREFNETVALQAATDQFWQHGYAATSMRDLAASDGPDGAGPLQRLRRQASSVCPRTTAVSRLHDARPAAPIRDVVAAETGDPTLLRRDRRPFDQRSRAQGMLSCQLRARCRATSKRTLCRDRQTIRRYPGILRTPHCRRSSRWNGAVRASMRTIPRACAWGAARHPRSCALHPRPLIARGCGAACAGAPRFARRKRKKTQ
jgi:hypothetical protein